MGVAQAVRSFFSSAVRQRGIQYAESGAVDIVGHDDDWVEVQVEGSQGWHYDVSLQKLGEAEFGFDCTCPHFEDGNYCKHLWAAILVADEQGLFADKKELRLIGNQTANKKPRSVKAMPKAKQVPWQKQLDRQSHYLPTRAPLSSTGCPRRVHYLLEAIAGGVAPVISLHQQERRKNGDWGIVKPLSVDHDKLAALDALAGIESHDRAALAMLLSNRVQDPFRYEDYRYRKSQNSRHATRVEINPLLYETVLPALAATGRLVWLLSEQQGWDDASVIKWEEGPAWRFQVRAEPFDRNRQWRLTGELARGKQIRPASEAIRCFSSGLLLIDDQLCRFEAPGDYRWVETLLANEQLVVSQSERESLLEELWRTGEPPQLVGDESLRVPHEVGTPIGRLVVHPPEKLPSYLRLRQQPLFASVSYLYDGHEVVPNGSHGSWYSQKRGRMVSRNDAAEDVLFNRLLDLGLEPKATSHYGHMPPGHLQFSPRQLAAVVEAAVAEGWEVEAEGRRVRNAGAISVSVKSGVDWLDLEAEADFDGESVPLPKLLAALRSGERYVKLGDGSQGLLPQQWLEQYAPLADLASKEKDGALRFQTSQALLLDSLLSVKELDLNVRSDQRFKAWRKRLESFTGVKSIAAPKAFQGELRGYQEEGLGWLRFLEKFGFGGCLADDMGLGKTIQVLALLVGRRHRQPKGADLRPSLVVAPKSLVHNWRLEAERFAPRLVVADYTGTDRHDRVADFQDYDVVITTYGTLRQDAQRLSETEWDYAILDEAQAIKNPASQAAKASRLLNARHRLALSGTPVENHLGELWSIFEFLNPGLLGKSQTLTKLSNSHGETDEDRLAALRRGIAPFLLRRTKQQVLPQLPKKSEQELYCDLPPAQRKQYNELRDHYRASLTQKIDQSSLAKAKIHVLEALLRLRQAACHPGLIDRRQQSKPSAKLTLLMEQLLEVVSEGHKALVFSQFTTMLDIVRDRLDKAGIVYEHLDGKTSNRQQRVDRFQSDDACQAFLISLKAGGCGLNLTAADYVFLLDPWWNPAVEAQAIDRAHRIGQSRPVFAYRLIASDTVEEKILELQASKRDLADAIISTDSSLLKSLTAEDLQLLLS